MSEQTSTKLSFAETTVPALLAAARKQLALAEGVSWDEIERAVSNRAKDIVERNAHRVADPPAQQWLHSSSLVLAAFQELTPLTGKSEALRLLREALMAPFTEGASHYLEARFGISADAPEEAFNRISANFKRRGEERFGSAFVYVQDVQDVTRSFTNIQRCFFNDFFRANGAPEVTSIFCALDNVWAGALEAGPYRVRFDRPTTLAQGDDACRFQFSKRPSA